MIQSAGTTITPFGVGVAISNESADVSKYNFFVIVLQDPNVQGLKIACPYSRHATATTQNYVLYSFNNSYEYWNWFSITLSGTKFSFDGSYRAPYDSGSSNAGTQYSSVTLVAIYGIV